MRFLKKKLSDKRWMMEFSKKMLVMLSVCYASMLIFSAITIFLGKDTESLNTLIQQVTMVFSLGVVSYLIKSAIENVFKIQRKPNNIDSPDLLNNNDENNDE